MSDIVEVIKVECKEAQRGWKLINKVDMDKNDKVWKAKELKKAKKKPRKEDQ